MNILSDINETLPSLEYAQEVLAKVASVGYTYQKDSEFRAKIIEELEEVYEAIDQNHDQEHIEEEFGDLLNSVVNYARFKGINAETAMRKFSLKFARRFNGLEDDLHAMNKQFDDSTLEELLMLWQVQKQKEKKSLDTTT